MEVARGWGRGNESSLVHGCGVSVGDEQKALEGDGGDSCMRMWIAPNATKPCTLKWLKW